MVLLWAILKRTLNLTDIDKWPPYYNIVSFLELTAFYTSHFVSFDIKNTSHFMVTIAIYNKDNKKAKYIMFRIFVSFSLGKVQV